MAQLCLTCAQELAVFIGYAEQAPLDKKIEELKAEVVSRETELAKVPNHVEELINGIRNSVTDFIFAVSYSDSVDSSAPDESANSAVSGSNKGRKVAQRDDNAASEPTS
jgi:hypothetical protein